MKKLLITIPLLLVTQAGFAEGFYVAGGYDFLPGSSEVSLGYQIKFVAIEANMVSMGKEEPDTRPGPVNCLDVLAFVPLQPIFIKAGIVSGSSKKNGYNLGVGADFALIGNWAIRGQVTQYKMTEDVGGATESEHLISVGLKYQF